MKVEQLIREKIGTLSAGQRKVAEYVLKNQDLFSYSTLTKLSKEIAVSETTIIRLAYSLGFESFSSLQQKVREEILTEPQRRAEGSIAKGSCYQSVIAKEMLMLENWKNHLDEETLDHFITLLLEADKILVIGARSSYSASLWFGAILERLLGKDRCRLHFLCPLYKMDVSVYESTEKKRRKGIKYNGQHHFSYCGDRRSIHDR